VTEAAGKILIFIQAGITNNELNKPTISIDCHTWGGGKEFCKIPVVCKSKCYASHALDKSQVIGRMDDM
jgi:hypothetical protein